MYHYRSSEQKKPQDKSFLSLTEFQNGDSTRKEKLFSAIHQNKPGPGRTDICPTESLIKGSKWDWLGLIAYAQPVIVNLLGPQGSSAPCLCNALITTRHQQHWACSLPFTHPMPKEYISILCFKRAVACNRMALG